MEYFSTLHKSTMRGDLYRLKIATARSKLCSCLKKKKKNPQSCIEQVNQVTQQIWWNIHGSWAVTKHGSSMQAFQWAIEHQWGFVDYLGIVSKDGNASHRNPFSSVMSRKCQWFPLRITKGRNKGITMFPLRLGCGGSRLSRAVGLSSPF